MDKYKKLLCNELDRINEFLNESYDCITLSDYITMTFAYYKFIEEEFDKMSNRLEDEFCIDKIKIIDINKGKEDNSWDIVMSLSFKNEYFSKNIYFSFIDGKVVDLESIKLKNKSSLDKLVVSGHFIEMINFAIEHFNFLSLDTRLLFEKNDDFVWLITNIKSSVPSVIFGNSIFSLTVDINNNKRVFINNRVIDNHDDKICEYLNYILIDMDKLPLFIKDYVSLYTKKIDSIFAQEEKDINKTVVYMKTLK